jgi:SET domain
MTTAASVVHSSQLISTHHFGEVWLNPIDGQKSFFATRAFKPGDVICDLSTGRILSQPTYLTVQLSDTDHFMLQPEHLQYINHSCNPNVCFDLDSMKVICVRPIEIGDELGYFYPSTEWDMAQPFNCLCQQSNCLGKIQGAMYLPKKVLKNYRFTSFIKNKLNELHSQK